MALGAARPTQSTASSNPLRSERAQARPRSLSQSSSQAAQSHPSLLPPWRCSAANCSHPNSDRNECRHIRRRLFARQIPGLLAPTMQQAAAHAMSTGDCGDVRAQRETLRHYPSALLVAPTPATACSANQLDTAVALVTLATVLMIVILIVILHGEPRRDLGPPMLSHAPQIGRWRRRAANARTTS